MSDPPAARGGNDPPAARGGNDPPAARGTSRPPPADVGDEVRQAVVFIHGIGRQPPMRTLRTFTYGIGLRRLFSSPDRVTDSLELRRLTQPPAPDRRAYTDFFELYWADHALHGGWLATLWWVFRLLLRRDWWRRRGMLARIVVGLQVLLALVAALLLWSLVDTVRTDTWSGVLGVFGRWQLWMSVLLAAVGLPLWWFLRSVLSDAVRYLAPNPANLAARRAIRDEGLTLLRRLHTCDRYERVVVVGHSLGSVIGYDLIAGLWDDLRHPDPRVAGDQAYIGAFDDAADRIDPSGSPPAGAESIPPPPSAAQVEAFQRAQHDLWLAGRADGVPWLVTDFVTLGSPLTYAALLFAEPDEPFGGRPGLSFADRQALKEYPRCPPIADELEPSRFYTRRYVVGDDVVPLQVGHTAAPFGPTRWTNLYQRPRWPLRGDPIGGPLFDVIGPGVRDVPVVVAGDTWWAGVRRFFPFSHPSYFWAPGGGSGEMPAAIDLPGPRDPPAATVPALVTALHLPELDEAHRPDP